MSKKTSSLNVRISSDLKQKIVQETQKLGMTVTEYVEYILSQTNNIDSESVLSDNFMSRLGSILENNSVLGEIKELSNQNQQVNREILKAIETPKDGQIILTDEALEQKLLDLLNIMKDEEIRYEKDGESLLGDAETTNDVLGIIINNYHSQIINK